MEHSTLFDIKKESMMAVGNLLTTIASEHIEPILDRYDTLLKSYLRGTTMISDVRLIENILDTIEHLGELDKQYGRQGPRSFMARLEIAGGLDALEEL